MRSIFAVVALPILAACSANVGSQDGADADTTSVAAVVVVEQSTGPGEAVHTESVARFVRTHGAVDDMARAMVGEALDLPAPGACKAVSFGEDLAPLRPIELLDVGALTLEGMGSGTGSHASLVARRVPDVVDLVSGVVYTTREAPAFGGHVTLHATGSTELVGFTATADAPAPIDGLHVNGLDVPSGNAVFSATTTHVELAWAPGSDAIYVDLAIGKAPASTRCSFKDDGKGSIWLVGDSGTLTVHRVREAQIRARGIDEGTLRFDTSRVIAFTRR